MNALKDLVKRYQLASLVLLWAWMRWGLGISFLAVAAWMLVPDKTDDIDDSGIDHMVYPKDLVAGARAHKHLSEDAADSAASGGITRLRCEAGEPCLRTGHWFTPAQVNSRRVFQAGEVMPSVGGDYGLTIWQWDERQ